MGDLNTHICSSMRVETFSVWSVSKWIITPTNLLCSIFSVTVKLCISVVTSVLPLQCYSNAFLLGSEQVQEHSPLEQTISNNRYNFVIVNIVCYPITINNAPLQFYTLHSTLTF